MNIFLIGYRGSGKTSAGRSLSDILGWPFIDADFQLVKELWMPISEIVDKKGWNFFRENETAVLKKLCALDKHVIATGGGVVLNKENTANMKKSGVIIWLKATPETVKKRIQLDNKTKNFRPPLTSKEIDEEIEETILKRKPLYENAMDFFIDTDNLDINGVCKAIMINLA